MRQKGQWLILPYAQVKHLPGLRLSPIGVVPQHSRRPRTIVDYTYHGVNQETVRLTAPEAMQFGRTLQRLLQRIGDADPKHGPVHMIKVDISDGFYRVHVNPDHAVRLGVTFPPAPDGTRLVAFPMVLPMGWVNSPPLFRAVTETITDISNKARTDRDYPKAYHRLEKEATRIPDTRVHNTKQTRAPSTSEASEDNRTGKPPLVYYDIYVDDFLGLGQGSLARLQGARRLLFHKIDTVLRPLDLQDPPARTEPISVKKLLKGDASWSTRKEVLGWVIDSVAGTITLPPRRLTRLGDILEGLPRTKKRIATKEWHKVLGELRSMVLAVPGLRGMFSLLQEALRTDVPRVRLSKSLHDFLDDIRWLHHQLGTRPTLISETYPRQPCGIGACDASGHGMGGVYFQHTQDQGTTAYLWRAAFDDKITQRITSDKNPKGTITNSDLELAATIAQHDIAMQLRQPPAPTIFTATDNTPALAWQKKGSVSTTGPAAYLLRVQALHQRHYAYIPQHSHIAGKDNVMADDCSRLFDLCDSQLLAQFNDRYPQATPWRQLQLRSEMHSSLISALQKKRPAPASYLLPNKPPTKLGTSGANSVATCTSTPCYAASTTPLPFSKFTHTVCARENDRAVTSPSRLLLLLPPCAKWARRWPSWGPLTLA